MEAHIKINFLSLSRKTRVRYLVFGGKIFVMHKCGGRVQFEMGIDFTSLSGLPPSNNLANIVDKPLLFCFPLSISGSSPQYRRLVELKRCDCPGRCQHFAQVSGQWQSQTHYQMETR